MSECKLNHVKKCNPRDVVQASKLDEIHGLVYVYDALGIGASYVNLIYRDDPSKEDSLYNLFLRLNDLIFDRLDVKKLNTLLNKKFSKEELDNLLAISGLLNILAGLFPPNVVEYILFNTDTSKTQQKYNSRIEILNSGKGKNKNKKGGARGENTPQPTPPPAAANPNDRAIVASDRAEGQLDFGERQSVNFLGNTVGTLEARVQSQVAMRQRQRNIVDTGIVSHIGEDVQSEVRDLVARQRDEWELKAASGITDEQISAFKVALLRILDTDSDERKIFEDKMETIKKIYESKFKGHVELLEKSHSENTRGSLLSGLVTVSSYAALAGIGWLGLNHASTLSADSGCKEGEGYTWGSYMYPTCYGYYASDKTINTISMIAPYYAIGVAVSAIHGIPQKFRDMVQTRREYKTQIQRLKDTQLQIIENNITNIRTLLTTQLQHIATSRDGRGKLQTMLIYLSDMTDLSSLPQDANNKTKLNKMAEENAKAFLTLFFNIVEQEAKEQGVAITGDERDTLAELQTNIAAINKEYGKKFNKFIMGLTSDSIGSVNTIAQNIGARAFNIVSGGTRMAASGALNLATRSLTGMGKKKSTLKKNSRKLNKRSKKHSKKKSSKRK